jgi:hypothetical protein
MDQIQSNITLWGIVAILVYVILIIAFILMRMEGARLKKFSNEAIGQNLLLGSSIIIGVLTAVSIFFIIELIQLNKNLNSVQSVFKEDASQSEIDKLTTQYTAADSSRSAVEAEYNDALARMDSLTGTNPSLNSNYTQKLVEIDGIKDNIRVELRKKNIDIDKTKSMLKELNGKITDLLTEINKNDDSQ